MNPIVVSKSMVAAAATGISTSQGPISAGNKFTLNGSKVSGGVATFDTQRRVIITSAGNDSGITFTITGTNDDGSVISETLTGANATAAVSGFDYLTVTSIVANGTTASTVTAGTNTTGSTKWFEADWVRNPVLLTLFVSMPAGGGTTASIEFTPDDPNVQPIPWNTAVEPLSNNPPKAWSPGAAFASFTSDQVATLGPNPFFAFRLTINSGTGTVKMQAMQAGYRGA